jgi:NADH:ubiquinone oxidoreductase subunit E
MSNKRSDSKKPENVLIALKQEQAQSGYLSPEFMRNVAKSYSVPENEVYGVASFYSFLPLGPMGRNIIRICRSLPCHLKEGPLILAALESELGIKPGQTTADGCFTLEVTNCIGLCDRAPAMLINNDPHVDLTPAKVKNILDSYR